LAGNEKAAGNVEVGGKEIMGGNAIKGGAPWKCEERALKGVVVKFPWTLITRSSLTSLLYLTGNSITERWFSHRIWGTLIFTNRH
jgi:hypothetical protein